MIPLVHALRNSIKNSSLFYFLSGEEELSLGYITFPRITGDPSTITYFPGEELLAVLSSSSDEIVLVDPNDKEVLKRFSAEGSSPKAPSLFFPPTSSALYIADGGIDEDGLVLFSSEGQINVLVDTGDGDIEEISGAIYNPVNREAYLADTGLSVIHRLSTEGVIETNYFSLSPATETINGFDLDQDQNRLLIADADNNLLRVLDLESGGDETKVDLSYEPFGVAWDEQNNLIYVVSESFSTIDIYDEDLNTINIKNELDYPGLISDIRYNPTYRKMQLKVTIGYNGEDNLLFIDYDAVKEELFISNVLVPDIDINVPITFISELDKFYYPYENAIRGYEALHTARQTKTLGGKASILTSLNFSDRSGIVSIDGLTLTVIGDSFNVRNNNVNLAEQFEDYISSEDSCVYARFFSFESENALILGFDNGVLLAVDSSFSVIKSIKTADLIINANGSDIKVNSTNEKSAYEVISVGYNRLFNLLYVCFPEGESDESTDNNGSVVIYNLEDGLSDIKAIAYQDPPDSVSRLRDLEVSPSSNLLYVIGETDDSSILQTFDSTPSNGELNLRSQQTADSNPTNLVEFNKNIAYSSETSEKLSYVRTVVGAEQEEVDLEGSFKELAVSEKYGFLYTIDTTNNRLLAFNEEFELYGLTQIEGEPKSLATFEDSVYVSYGFNEIDLPSLKNTINSDEDINRIQLESELETRIEVGDIIEISQNDETYLLVSLSKGSPNDEQIFVDTFSPLEDLTPGDTTIRLTGDRVVRISQVGLERIEGSQVADFIQESVIENEFENYYSISFEPYFLTNNMENTGFQSTEGSLKLLGDREEGKISDYKYYLQPYLYFINDNNELFRLNVLDLSLQQVRLDRDVSDIKDFIVSEEAIYLIESDSKEVYKLTTDKEESDEIEFSTSESLELDKSPQSLFLNTVEKTINVYTELGTNIKVST